MVRKDSTSFPQLPRDGNPNRNTAPCTQEAPGSSGDPIGQRGGKYTDDLLRGAVAIAAYYPGDPAKYRKIYHWASTGRFPHFREGKTVICSRKSTIDRWIALTEMYGLLGRTWGPEDVLKYFGPEMEPED